MSASELAYYGVFGEPLFKVVGMTAAAVLATAAGVQVLNRRGAGIPFKVHSRLAWTGLVLMLTHVSLAILG